jgi:hypothetical protein
VRGLCEGRCGGNSQGDQGRGESPKKKPYRRTAPFDDFRRTGPLQGTHASRPGDTEAVT